MSETLTYTITPKGAREYRNAEGERHREDGPAIEYASGARHYYRNGERHREDGPAIEYASGAREWWLNGEYLTEEEHAARTGKRPAPTEMMIDGIVYILTPKEG